MATGIRIRFRRDIESAWDSVNPVLESGELGYVTDIGKFKIGNGTDDWATLGYFSTQGVGNTGVDSDWVISQISGGVVMAGVDSEWVLSKIKDPAGVDSDWVLAQVGDPNSYFYQTLISTLQTDSEQPIAAAAGGPDSDWVLNQITAGVAVAGADSEYVLAQVAAEETTRSNADSDLSARIDAIENGEVAVLGIGPDSEYVLGRVASEASTRSNADSDLSARIDAIENGEVAVLGVGPDSEYVLAQVGVEATTRSNADSDLSARIAAIENGEVAVASQVDSDWVVRTIKRLDVDSDWVTKQLYTKAQSDSDLLRKTQVTSTFYVNTGGDSFIQAIAKVGTSTAKQIILPPGSIGATANITTINNASTLSITAPANSSGSTATEILGKVIVTGASSTRVRFSNVSFDSEFELNGTLGRHTFKGVTFQKFMRITGSTTNFLTFEDCYFDGGFVVPNTFAGVIYLVRCAFNGIAPTLGQASPLQVIMSDCSGLPSFPTNATLFANNALTTGFTRWTGNELRVGGKTINGNLDSDWVIRTAKRLDVDSDWILRQIPRIQADSDWVIRTIKRLDVDSDWILNQIAAAASGGSTATTGIIDSEFLAFGVDNAPLLTTNKAYSTTAVGNVGRKGELSMLIGSKGYDTTTEARNSILIGLENSPIIASDTRLNSLIAIGNSQDPRTISIQASGWNIQIGHLINYQSTNFWKTGQFNTLIGHNSSVAVDSSSTSAPSYNVLVGYGAQSTRNNSVAIGYGATVDSDNTFVVGQDSALGGITKFRIPGMGFDTEKAKTGQIIAKTGTRQLGWVDYPVVKNWADSEYVSNAILAAVPGGNWSAYTTPTISWDQGYGTPAVTGTIVRNRIRSVSVGGGMYQVEMEYIQSSAGTNGQFADVMKVTLPNGLQFDSDYLTTYGDDNAGASCSIVQTHGIVSGNYFNNPSWSSDVKVVPWLDQMNPSDRTKFLIFVVSSTNNANFVGGSGANIFPVTSPNLVMKLHFTFKALV